MKFTNILVPVTGVPLDEEAIQLACQIVKRDKATLLLFHVIELQRALPLNAESTPKVEHAERILDFAEAIARKAGVAAETDLLQARLAGTALVDAASERGVDLIVMALPYRRKLDRLYIGTTALYVLDHARCRVWTCRAPAAEGDK